MKAPVPSEETRPLFEAALRVLSGQMTVTAAAQQLGLSRLRFQTLLNRGLTGLLEALEPQARGRPAMPEVERKLREEVATLQRDNAHLEQRLGATVRMMGVASEWVQKGLRSTRTPRTAKPAETPVSDADDEGPAAALAAVARLRESGVCVPLACTAVGVAPSTMRRWAKRSVRGAALRTRRGPRRRPGVKSECVELAVRVVVAHRRIGAATLAKTSGLSRRQALAVKEAAATEAERQRRRDAVRVQVECGVVRAFDAIDVRGRPVLVAADGAVPYRTSAEAVSRYDGDMVARFLEADLERHGAPLVMRADRWKAHDTPQVRRVLEAHGVLMLHGPPHCPRFYGQLERQNREHGEWLRETELELQEACESMLKLFNELIPRRSLGWRTSGEAWRSRTVVKVDRAELAAEVAERVKELKEKASRVAYPWKLERQAIEAALINRGLLRLTKGGWC